MISSVVAHSSIYPSLRPRTPASISTTSSAKPFLDPSILPYPSSFPNFGEKESSYPSGFENHLPSQLLSTAPTEGCYDHKDYRSPINGLTCANHFGTECISWRYILKGNITALEDLINNCPVSCRIECGAFQQQKITLSFTVSGLHSLLDIETQTPLEDITLQYLPKFVEGRKIDNNASFVLEKVGLKSQEPLSPLRKSSQSSTVSNHPISIQLRVTLFLSGFSISFHQDELNRLLIEGIDSAGFTSKLQTSSTFFSKANVSSAVREIPKAIESPLFSERKPSNETSTMSFLVPLTLIAIFTGFIILYFRLRKRTLLSSLKEIMVDVDSPQISTFSFSRTSTLPISNKLQLCEENLLGSLSRSKDPEDSIRNKDHFPSPYSRSSIIEDKASKNEENEAHSHPLAAVIPPMIVIDNIDEKEPQEEDIGNNQRSRGKQIMPVQHVAAPSSFIRALNKAQSPIALTEITSSTFGSRTVPNMKSRLKPLDSIEDDALSMPTTPVKVDLDPFLMLKKSTSTGDVERMKSVASLSSRMRSSFFPPSSIGFLTRYGDSKSRHKNKVEPTTPIIGRTILTPSWTTTESYEVKQNIQSQQEVLTPTQRLEHGFQLISQSDNYSNDNTFPEIPDGLQLARRKKIWFEGINRQNSVIANSEIRYTFEASTTESLGLIIESSRRKKGSRIRIVNEDSPLYGMVCVGDRIVSIDSIDTSEMNSTAISTLLLSKRRKKAGTIVLIVARSVENNENSPAQLEVQHTRSTSLDSSIKTQRTAEMDSSTLSETELKNVPFLLQSPFIEDVAVNLFNKE